MGQSDPAQQQPSHHQGHGIGQSETLRDDRNDRSDDQQRNKELDRGVCRDGFHSLSGKSPLPVYSQFVNIGDTSTRHPRGLTAFGVFLFWGAAMATLAGTTLLWQGTILDRVWSLNPRAYHQLAPLGTKAGIPLLIVAGALASAGIGWFNRRHWGWCLAVAIIGTQIAGDLVNVILGYALEGVVGIAAGGALLVYLLKRSVRAGFRA